MSAANSLSPKKHKSAERNQMRSNRKRRGGTECRVIVVRKLRKRKHANCEASPGGVGALCRTKCSQTLTQIALGAVQNQIRLQDRCQNTVPDRPQRVEVQFSPALEATLLLLLFGAYRRHTCTASRRYHAVAETRVQADALFGGCVGHVEQRAILFAQAAAGADHARRAAVGHVVVVLVADQRSSYGHCGMIAQRFRFGWSDLKPVVVVS